MLFKCLNKKKKKEKNTSIIETNNGKIAFFGQGQPVHFDYVFSLVHILSFCPHGSPFSQDDCKTFEGFQEDFQF